MVNKVTSSIITRLISDDWTTHDSELFINGKYPNIEIRLLTECNDYYCLICVSSNKEIIRSYQWDETRVDNFFDNLYERL